MTTDAVISLHEVLVTLAAPMWRAPSAANSPPWLAEPAGRRARPFRSGDGPALAGAPPSTPRPLSSLGSVVAAVTEGPGLSPRRAHLHSARHEPRRGRRAEGAHCAARLPGVAQGRRAVAAGVVFQAVAQVRRNGGGDRRAGIDRAGRRPGS